MKYRKKPVIIEAYRTNEEKVIHTLEGDMKAFAGDYVITGVKGEQYPCKPDIFKKTYEEVKTTGMTFGEAIQAVKNGERCARSNCDYGEVCSLPLAGWQYTNTGRIDGWNDDLDMNEWYK